jgi:UDP-N-acetylmuramoyl-tripeptide--D-alanyl-D-alanine ligase
MPRGIKVSEILKATDAFLLRGSLDNEIYSFSIDSRTIKKRDFFICLKGKNYDAHDFIEEAIRKKASGVLIDRDINYSGMPSNFIILKTNNTLDALGKLSSYIRDEFDFKIIAVTGSNGKTITKELISCLLTKKYKIFKNYLNQNNYIGVSLNILNANNDYDFGVFEVGTSFPGELKKLLSILKPNFGVITNIGHTHLQYFGNQDNVLKEKMEMLKFLPKDGICFINGDDKYLKKIKRDFRIKIVRFGLDPKNNIWADDIKTNFSGIKFKLFRRYELYTKILGFHNIYNILAAISVAKNFGIDFLQIKEALEDFQTIEGRMKIIFSNNIKIIDDSYNSNPDSLLSAIGFLTNCNSNGKKILIVSDMLELGENSPYYHYKIGKSIPSDEIDYLFAYGNKIKDLIKGAIDSNFPKERIFFTSKEKIVKKLREKVEKEDVLLFKASHSMGISNIMDEFISLI